MSFLLGAQEKQVAWQAMKKASGGNTCWTGNIAMSSLMMVATFSMGFLGLTKGFGDLSLGRNKFR